MPDEIQVNEPIFRKGELLMWDSTFENKESTGYRERWGLGPFICDRDIYDLDETIQPEEIQTRVLSGWARAAWAKRFRKAVFLNAVKEALAEADRG